MATPEAPSRRDEILRRIDRTIVQWRPGRSVGRMLVTEIIVSGGIPVEPVKSPDGKTIIAFEIPNGEEGETLPVVVERGQLKIGELSLSTVGLADFVTSGISSDDQIKAARDVFKITLNAAREVSRVVSSPPSRPVRRTLP